jgi:predicted DNA-binding transcriptional regulator AlpA
VIAITANHCGLCAGEQPTGAVRLDQILTHWPISRCHLYRLIQRGQFPKQIQQSHGLALWDAAEVRAWMATQTQQPEQHMRSRIRRVS